MLAELQLGVMEAKNGKPMPSAARRTVKQSLENGFGRGMRERNPRQVLVAYTEFVPIGLITQTRQNDTLVTDAIYAHHIGNYRAGSALFRETCLVDASKVLIKLPLPDAMPKYERWGLTYCTDRKNYGSMEIFGQNLQDWRKCCHGNYPRFETPKP